MKQFVSLHTTPNPAIQLEWKYATRLRFAPEEVPEIRRAGVLSAPGNRARARSY